jgi:hypothetical protein
MVKEQDQSKQKKVENGYEVVKEFNYIKARTAFRNVLNANTEFLHSLLPAIASMNYHQERKFKVEILKLTDDCLNESCTSSWSSHSTGALRVYYNIHLHLASVPVRRHEV